MKKHSWLGCLGTLKEAEKDARAEIKEKADKNAYQAECEFRIATAGIKQAIENAKGINTPCRKDFDNAVQRFEQCVIAITEGRLVGLKRDSVLQTQAYERLNKTRQELYNLIYYPEAPEDD